MQISSFNDKDIAPLWEGKTIYRETVMFIGKNDKAPLLYKPTQILSITDYGGETSYELGKDVILNDDGSLSLTKNTRIPFITEEEYYHDNPSSLISIPHNGKETYIYWGDTTAMTKWQIALSYTHDSYPIISAPPCYSQRYERFFSKLLRGKDATVFFYGDSITVGGNCSYCCKTPPYMPSWTMLLSEYIARKYDFSHRYINTELPNAMPVPTENRVIGTKGMLTYLNTAFGGWDSAQGIKGLDERVLAPISRYGCDLFVLAFGMNDIRVAPENFIENIRNIIDCVLDAAPDTAILLISPMYPNPDSSRWCGNQPSFEPFMKELADAYAASGVPCSVVPMTELSRKVLSKKRFCDTSGNNINHPNDFVVRLYATGAIQTLIGY